MGLIKEWRKEEMDGGGPEQALPPVGAKGSRKTGPCSTPSLGALYPLQMEPQSHM